jgi:hypothetical protein
MDVDDARLLLQRTLDETRLRSEVSCVLLWQTEYETPLMPHLDARTNLRLEKLTDRIGMLPRDDPRFEDPLRFERMLAELESYGVRTISTVEQVERAG